MTITSGFSQTDSSLTGEISYAVTSNSTGSTWVTRTSPGSIVRYENTIEEEDGDTSKKKVNSYINPKLYFSLVKSKLDEKEKKALQFKLKKLALEVKKMQRIGQRAAFEKFADELTLVVRELEAISIGCGKYVLKDTIEKFEKFVNLKSTIFFSKLEKFPRSIPDNIVSIIESVQNKGVFDEYWILYINSSNDKKPIKTNKEVIKEKDPILFGKFNQDDNKFFYIVDWEDEFCDLTMKQFIEKISESKDFPGLNVQSDILVDLNCQKIDENFISDIVEKSNSRFDRLKKVNRKNYQDLMVEEEIDAQVPEEKPESDIKKDEETIIEKLEDLSSVVEEIPKIYETGKGIVAGITKAYHYIKNIFGKKNITKL